MGEIIEDEEDTPPATLATVPEVARKDFANTFIVHDRGQKYEVATNAVANRAIMQMNVAKLRMLCDRTLRVYEENQEMVPSPKELKILADAVSTVDEMSNTAYSDAKAGHLTNSLERLVYAATRGAAAGSARLPTTNSAEDRLRRLKSIGKSGKVIEMAPSSD